MNEAELNDLVENLFKNGFGEKADRLVLTTKEGRDLGGLCKQAVKDQIRKIENSQ